MQEFGISVGPLLDAIGGMMSGGSACIFDADLRYQWAAGPGLDLAGLEPAALVGRTVADLFAPEDVARVRPFYERALAGETVRFDLRVFARTWEITAARIRLNPPLILVLSEDVELLRSQQVVIAEKAAFLAEVAHELRQPLAAIGPALAVLEGHPPPEVAQRLFASVGRQVAHLRRLIDDLTDLSRLGSGRLPLQLAEVDLTALLEELLEVARASAPRHFALVADGPVRLRADAQRLHQAFGNIVFNAVRHTAPGGAIAVTVAVADGAAVVSIVDDGEGIAADALSRVFDLYYQGPSRTGRMGLGLHVVRGIVEQHGGHVHALSAGEGLGATFVVSLPLAGPHGQARASATAAVE